MALPPGLLVWQQVEQHFRRRSAAHDGIKGPALSIVVMGVAGCGKSTVATRIQDTLCKYADAFDQVAFVEADDYHTSSNKAKMANGTPLTDADRLPWLRAVRETVMNQPTHPLVVITACSALKRSYRQELATGTSTTVFLHLSLTRDEAERRLNARSGHFAGVSLAESQFATLEALNGDEMGVTVDVRVRNVADVVADFLLELNRRLGEWLIRSDQVAAVSKPLQGRRASSSSSFDVVDDDEPTKEATNAAPTSHHRAVEVQTTPSSSPQSVPKPPPPLAPAPPAATSPLRPSTTASRHDTFAQPSSEPSSARKINPQPPAATTKSVPSHGVTHPVAPPKAPPRSGGPSQSSRSSPTPLPVRRGVSARYLEAVGVSPHATRVSWAVSPPRPSSSLKGPPLVTQLRVVERDFRHPYAGVRDDAIEADLVALVRREEYTRVVLARDVVHVLFDALFDHDDRWGLGVPALARGRLAVREDDERTSLLRDWYADHASRLFEVIIDCEERHRRGLVELRDGAWRVLTEDINAQLLQQVRRLQRDATRRLRLAEAAESRAAERIAEDAAKLQRFRDEARLLALQEALAKPMPTTITDKEAATRTLSRVEQLRAAPALAAIRAAAADEDDEDLDAFPDAAAGDAHVTLFDFRVPVPFDRLTSTTPSSPIVPPRVLCTLVLRGTAALPFAGGLSTSAAAPPLPVLKPGSFPVVLQVGRHNSHVLHSTAPSKRANAWDVNDAVHLLLNTALKDASLRPVRAAVEMYNATLSPTPPSSAARERHGSAGRGRSKIDAFAHAVEAVSASRLSNSLAASSRPDSADSTSSGNYNASDPRQVALSSWVTLCEAVAIAWVARFACLDADVDDGLEALASVMERRNVRQAAAVAAPRLVPDMDASTAVELMLREYVHVVTRLLAALQHVVAEHCRGTQGEVRATFGLHRALCKAAATGDGILSVASVVATCRARQIALEDTPQHSAEVRAVTRRVKWLALCPAGRLELGSRRVNPSSLVAAGSIAAKKCRSLPHLSPTDLWAAIEKEFSGAAASEINGSTFLAQVFASPMDVLASLTVDVLWHPSLSEETDRYARYCQEESMAPVIQVRSSLRDTIVGTVERRSLWTDASSLFTMASAATPAASCRMLLRPPEGSLIRASLAQLDLNAADAKLESLCDPQPPAVNRACQLLVHGLDLDVLNHDKASAFAILQEYALTLGCANVLRHFTSNVFVELALLSGRPCGVWDAPAADVYRDVITLEQCHVTLGACARLAFTLSLVAQHWRYPFVTS